MLEAFDYVRQPDETIQKPERKEQASIAVEEIGESHNRRGHDIRPELYELWLDALCESVKKHDSEYTGELESMWREAMRPPRFDRVLAAVEISPHDDAHEQLNKKSRHGAGDVHRSI